MDVAMQRPFCLQKGPDSIPNLSKYGWGEGSYSIENTEPSRPMDLTQYKIAFNVFWGMEVPAKPMG